MRFSKLTYQIAPIGLLLGIFSCDNPLNKYIPGKISIENSTIQTSPRNPSLENQVAFSAELKSIKVLCEPQISKNSSKSSEWLNWSRDKDLYNLKVTIEASGTKMNDVAYQLTYPTFGNNHPVFMVKIEALDSHEAVVSSGSAIISFPDFGGNQRAVGTLSNLTSHEINQIDHIEVAWNYN